MLLIEPSRVIYNCKTLQSDEFQQNIYGLLLQICFCTDCYNLNLYALDILSRFQLKSEFDFEEFKKKCCSKEISFNNLFKISFLLHNPGDFNYSKLKHICIHVTEKE